MDQKKATRIKITLGSVVVVYDDEDMLIEFPDEFKILMVEGTKIISCENGVDIIEISADESKNQLKRKIAKYNLLNPESQIYIT